MKKPPETAGLRAFCRNLGVDEGKRDLVARIAKECGLNALPKRLPKALREKILDQFAARTQDQVKPKDADRPLERPDKASMTTLADEKLRKTIAERELLELKAERTRRALLRLFTERAITPRLKVAFCPLTAFLKKSLSKSSILQWNQLCETASAEFEAGLKEDADNWMD